MKVSLRAIIIEDNYLLAETLADALVMLGCQVISRASNLKRGLEIADTARCDFVVVDLNLKGAMAYAILDRLHDRGVPYLIATGTFAEEIPARHLHAPRLSKPYDLQELRQALSALLPQASRQSA